MEIQFDNPEQVEQLFTQEDASNAVENMFKQLKEYQEIMEMLKPLLFCLSKAMYGEDEKTIQLAQLVEDGCHYIGGLEKKLND